MRIVLRDSRKRLYFRYGRVWTYNPEAAFDFQQSQDIYKFVADRQLHGVEAVLILENPRRLESVALESLETAATIQEAA